MLKSFGIHHNDYFAHPSTMHNVSMLMVTIILIPKEHRLFTCYILINYGFSEEEGDN